MVHPFHGPVRVISIADRAVSGTTRRYVDLEASQPGLRISVPIDQVEHIGIREVSSPQRVTELLDLLGGPSEVAASNWARRIKDFQERASTGRLEDLCYVIREITLAGPRPPASAEGMLLRETRARLAAEFSLALRISFSDAERVIHTATQEKAIA